MDIMKEIIKINVKTIIQYRRAFILTLIMQSASILIYILLFQSIYSYNNTSVIKGYTLSQMVWYFAAANFVSACVLCFTDSRISGRVISGDLTIDLLRPISLLWIELSHAISLKVLGIPIEFLLGFIIYSLILFPSFISVVSFTKFILLIPGSFIINFIINYIIGLLAFCIKDTNSLGRIKMFIISFIGGAFIPLEFFPQWWNRVLDFLPFKYIYYWPIQIFLNKEISRGYDVFIKILAVQIFWGLVLFIISKILWKSVIKQFCGAGG